MRNSNRPQLGHFVTPHAEIMSRAISIYMNLVLLRDRLFIDHDEQYWAQCALSIACDEIGGDKLKLTNDVRRIESVQRWYCISLNK